MAALLRWPAKVADAFALASPKDLVMQAGRPLLLVPDRIDWLDLRSVLVAWKDTPETRRAIAVSRFRAVRERPPPFCGWRAIKVYEEYTWLP